jgi:hypothetical protein
MANHGNDLFILDWSIDALYPYRREDSTHIISYWLLDHQRMGVEGAFHAQNVGHREIKSSG